MEGSGNAVNSCRVIGAPGRSLAFEPLPGPFFSHHFCMPRFQTMAACNKVDFPLLFGPASKVSGSSGNSCVSNRFKYWVVILVIIIVRYLCEIASFITLHDGDFLRRQAVEGVNALVDLALCHMVRRLGKGSHFHLAVVQSGFTDNLL